MNWIYVDIAAFLIVMLIAGFIIPQVLLIAFRKKLFDEVDPRKVHKGAVPRLGGISFFPSILFSMLFMFGICRQFAPSLMDHVFQSSLTGMCFISCAVIILYLLGMADDLVGVKYRAKFMTQIFAAVLIVIGGICMNNLHGFLWVGTIPIVPAIALTILLSVFITNAVNLIDGIDGLASGLSAMACAFYGIIFFKAGLHIYGMVAFATLGSLLPFFYYNVFGNVQKHRKIFMGDTGALTIGLILSVFSIRITGIDDKVFASNPAVLAFAPLIIPCFDVVRVYIHRLKEGRNPFLPDKSHIHHKLLALGMHQRVAMPTIVTASLLVTILNFWLSAHINITLLFALDIALWVTANFFLSRAIRKRQENTAEAA